MNFALVLNIARLMISYMPIIEGVLKDVEAALPAGSNGAQKLEVVRSGLSSAFDVAGVAKTEFDNLWPAIQAVINFTVAKFHKDGTFPPK